MPNLALGTVIDPADTRQNVITDKLIEKLTFESEVLRRLDVDQCVIDDEVAICAAN